MMRHPISQIRGIRQKILGHPWFSIIFGVSAVFVLAVYLMYTFEREADPNLSFFDAFRIVLVFLLGEYGDTPATTAGQMVSVVIFVLGVAVVAALIGQIAAIFVERKKEQRMPQNLEGHIVICNWHEGGDRIIQELHSPLAAPEKDILIISQTDVNEIELRQHPAYERVYFVKSDPTLHEVLRRARAHHAKSVILLSDPACSDPDAQTALIALAITKLEQHVQRKPHIIAEIVNPHKVQHLVDAGVDEWVCARVYGLGIIAQAALYGKISDVYQQLLTYSNETNEIYLVESEKYPPAFFGKSFHEIAAVLNQHRNHKNPVVLVGIKRDGRIILNPKAEDFDVLTAGDALIVMAFDQPVLHYLADA